MIPSDIANKLKNPGERAKLSDATLKKYAPALLAKRQSNLAKAQLYNPSAVLSGPALESAVARIVRGQYGPQEAELKRQGGYLDRQQRETSQRIGDVYSQLASLTAPSVGLAVSGAGQLADKISQSGAGLLNTINTAEKGYEDRAAQDAAIRGTGLDAGMATHLAAEFADQKMRAAAQAQGSQDVARAQSQGFIGNVGTAQAVLPAQAAQAQQDLANRVANQRQELLSKAADLKGAEGEAATKILMDLRDTEFQKGAAIQTLNLKSDVAAADAKVAAVKADKPYSSGAFAGMKPSVVSNMTQAQVDARQRRYNRQIHPRSAGDGSKMYTTGAFNGMTHKQVADLDPTTRQKKVDNWNNLVHPGRGKGKGETGITPFGNKLLAPAGQTKQQSNFGKLTAFAKTHIGKQGRHGLAKDLWQDSSSAELRKAIGLSTDTPEAVVSAALDIAQFGYLSRGTIHKLWHAGISVKGLGVSTKKPDRSAAKHIPGLGETVK
jgi:hypothetical protein